MPQASRLVLALLLLLPGPRRAAASVVADRVVVVLIDGLRYSEGLGDASAAFAPRMAALAAQGVKIEPFLNDGFTYTSEAIPASWMGGWFGSRDTVLAGQATQYALAPTLFEAYRKQLGRPAEDCMYFIKDVGSLWRQSFDPAYGPDYWPRTHMAGYSDPTVWEEFKALVPALHPRLIYLYLADVDGAGHGGSWSDYTGAILMADAIVGELWDFVQADPFYAGRTDLLVTNDHGRHDDAHGGFRGHGDGCPGCRTIMLLAVGPDFPAGVVSHTPRALPDLAPTVGLILGFEMPWATGRPMQEICTAGVPIPAPLPPAGLRLVALEPNPASGVQRIEWDLARGGALRLEVFDLSGRRRRALFVPAAPAGSGSLEWSGEGDDGRALEAGLYWLRLTHAGLSATGKFVRMR